MSYCPACKQFVKPDLIHGLKPEQWQVAGLVYEGLTYKEIASRLNTTEKTIKARATQVHKRWSVHSKTQVILKYLELKTLEQITKDDKA